MWPGSTRPPTPADRRFEAWITGTRRAAPPSRARVRRGPFKGFALAARFARQREMRRPGDDGEGPWPSPSVLRLTARLIQVDGDGKRFPGAAYTNTANRRGTEVVEPDGHPDVSICHREFHLSDRTRPSRDQAQRLRSRRGRPPECSGRPPSKSNRRCTAPECQGDGRRQRTHGRSPGIRRAVARTLRPQKSRYASDLDRT